MTEQATLQVQLEELDRAEYMLTAAKTDGEALVYIRKSLGLTQAELSIVLMWPKAWIEELEAIGKGSNVKVSHVEILSRLVCYAKFTLSRRVAE